MWASSPGVAGVVLWLVMMQSTSAGPRAAALMASWAAAVAMLNAMG